MSLLEWLESSAFSLWVGQSVYGYPVFLSLHALGLAIAVGTLVMLDLRVLGVLAVPSYGSLVAVMRLAWAGMVVNLLSGSALFVAAATSFANNRQFLIKITAVLLAVVLAGVLHVMLLRGSSNWSERSAPTAAKLLAAASVCLWLVAIISGRLIAYTDRLFVSG